MGPSVSVGRTAPLLGALALLACASAWSDPAAPPPALRILSSESVPANAKDYPTDVRFASDDSVYVSRFWSGVFEVALDGHATVRRKAMPSPDELKIRYGYQSLGASPTHMAAASSFYFMGWQPLTPEAEEKTESRLHKYKVPTLSDLDVGGDRLIFLGITKGYPYAPEGAIVWTGTFGQGLKDLRPIVFDKTGPGAHAFSNCGGREVGAVRVLSDGSMLAVPGSQPGIHLLRSDGMLVRSWESAAFGLDLDCSSMSSDYAALLARDEKARISWMNQHRIVDDILPLPHGDAGLLIRSFSGGRVSWDLAVLHPDGQTESYLLPLTGESPYARIRGDVRGNRVVLLLGDREWHMGAFPSAQLVLARLPLERPVTGRPRVGEVQR